MSKHVRVRFAPSPTGPLHIGGLRTALFNYLFAKKNSGDFIVRIEDTDQKRYVEGSEKHIIGSLEWCGLMIDEGPYRQSERNELYNEKINELISLGHAYYAFDSKEELEKLRLSYEKKGETFIYGYKNRLALKNSLSLKKEETESLIGQGKDYVIRFKNLGKGEVVCFDSLRGKVVFPINTLDDKVLYKSDGTPTYHFANVVDDFEMKISHVIRGEEWLPSLGLHWLLYDSFGWDKPKFVHLPLILKPQGKGKLSKRDGEKFGFPVYPIKWVSNKNEMLGYKELGFLPDALVNFLALLGWNPGTEKELFSMEDLIRSFSIKGLNNSGARFDPEKTIWFNQQHIRLLENGFLEQQLVDVLEKKGILFDKKKIPVVISLIRPRLDLMTKIYSASKCFFVRPSGYDKKGISKVADASSLGVLRDLAVIFQNSSAFILSNLKSDIHEYSKKNSLNFGKVLGLIRLSLVGELSGADLFEIIGFLEKEEAVKRIETLADYLTK